MFFHSSSGDLLSFNQFVIQEAVKPSPVSYGTDRHDSRLISLHGGAVVYTFFEHADKYYCVTLLRHSRERSEVGFGTSEIDSLDTLDYTDEKHTTRNALEVFNKILYVIVEMLKQVQPPYIVFSSADAKLGRLYDKAAKLPTFIELLRSVGYTYLGKRSGEHTFRRVLTGG